MKTIKNNKIQIFFLISKIIVHYFDTASDILLMLTVFDRSYDPIFPEFARKAYFQVAATMLFALLGERILTYYLFIEIKELMNAKEHPPSGTTLPSIF